MGINKVQLLRDPDIQPSIDVISKALGGAYDTYTKFANELSNLDIQISWGYYNDGKAWLAKGLHKWTGIRGGQNETTVFWLSIWDGFFKVTFYVPEKSRADIYNLQLGDDVNLMVADSNQMGKFKYFPITFDLDSDEMLKTVFLLADFKKSIK
jgi:hypothetical protein